jgi:hypothetical protein
MPKPTRGRIVAYHANPGERIAGSGDGPLVGIIVHVHSADLVNLAVFDANGNLVPGGRTSVLFVQGEPPKRDRYWCTWPERSG